MSMQIVRNDYKTIYVLHEIILKKKVDFFFQALKKTVSCICLICPYLCKQIFGLFYLTVGGCFSTLQHQIQPPVCPKK